MSKGRRLLLLAAATANAALALAVWTRQPWANGPAEWRWEYLPAGLAQASAAAWLVMLAALAGLGVLWGHRRLARWRGAPLAAVVCGAAFTFALVAVQPGGFARVAGALVSRNSFGYVWDAALAPPTGELLADYPAASAGLNQHSLTHPPGPLLAVRALGWLDRVLPPPCLAGPAGEGRGKGDESEGRGGGGKSEGQGGGDERRSIGARPAEETGDTSLPSLSAAAIAREVARARSHGRPVPQPPPGPWAVAALAVLLPALSALAAWPLYLLARRLGQARETALLAAVLWLLVPARSLFTPSFDQALPTLLVGAAWLAASGGRVRAAAAGALLFAACFTTYGCLSALPLVAAFAVASPGAAGARSSRAEISNEGIARQSRNEAEDEGRGTAGNEAREWHRWAALALGFVLPYLLLAVAAGHDPWHSLRTALALHHDIAVAPRSYATWLLWNPYDFALLLSPGVLGLAVAALVGSLRGGGPTATAARSPGAAPKAGRLPLWTWWGLMVILMLSGSVRGEAGRIWLPWMPFACLFAAVAVAGAWHRTDAPEGGKANEIQESTPRADGWRPGVTLLLATEAVLALALALCMIFVSAR